MELIRLAFTDGTIPAGFCESILVLIPKAEQGQFRGIALLDIVYKVVASVINTRITAAVTFHDALHGSVKSRGTGTGIMEAKLLSQLRKTSDDPLFMVFLDLKKAFYSLDRERALLVLEKYGVGPNLLRIIRSTWARDTMVPRQSGYFGRPFRAGRGVRVGDVMSPTIFNIIIDAVVRDWEARLSPIELDELSLFYIDDGCLTGLDAVRMQSSVNIITDCFNRFGLKMNATKTKFMILQGERQRPHKCSEAMWYVNTGAGRNFKQRMKEKVTCVMCGASVNRSSLKIHQSRAICRNARASYEPPTPVRLQAIQEDRVTPRGEPGSYTVSIPKNGTEDIECPVPGCAYRLSTSRTGKMKWGQFRHHFRSRHIEDSIRIEEEGQLPQCSSCGFFGSTVNSERHLQSKDCQFYTGKRHRHFRNQRQTEALAVKLTVSGEEIERVCTFRYLGRILSDDDDDSHAILRQLEKARKVWSRFQSILRSEGVKPRAMGYFYKTIIQTVLLYGSESWVAPAWVLKQVRSFHHRIARYIAGLHIKKTSDGNWICPSTEEVLEKAGLLTLEEYIRKRRDTVRSFVMHRPIYRACQRSAVRYTKRTVWWKLD